MDTIRNRLIALEEIPADRALVDRLAARGRISPRARDYALGLIHPARNWGLWISRLLAALGTALVLAGVVYFYAFNWNAIPAAVKLGSVEAALAGCMAAAVLRGLGRTSGKFFALATSALLGVFLAVFGQVYQTGADAWELFAAWALLILPFGAASCFAPVFGLWLVVANIALVLFWDQTHPIWHFEFNFTIFPIVAAFNLAVLAVREALEKRQAWLAAPWTRSMPGGFAIIAAVVPCTWLAADWNKLTPDVTWSATAGAAVLLGLYAFYRFIKPDVQTLAGTLLGAGLVAEGFLFRLLDLDHNNEAGLYLLLGLATIGLFAGMIAWLRHLSAKMEARHG